jgi:hypothetical protein
MSPPWSVPKPLASRRKRDPQGEGADLENYIIALALDHCQQRWLCFLIRQDESSEHSTTIEAPKSSQQLPPQSFLKVLRRTHHRKI